jgi:hypothetical protein
MGTPGPEPQRVLRPPRGRTQSQRSWSSNERARNGRGPLAQRQSRALVPRATTARRRSRASVGGDRRDRSSTAGRTHGPHHRTSRRAAALPLRPAGRGTCRGERACCGGRSRATRTIRHVTGAPSPRRVHLAARGRGYAMALRAVPEFSAVPGKCAAGGREMVRGGHSGARPAPSTPALVTAWETWTRIPSYRSWTGRYCPSCPSRWARTARGRSARSSRRRPASRRPR